jgi:hypothetical protein
MNTVGSVLWGSLPSAVLVDLAAASACASSSDRGPSHNDRHDGIKDSHALVSA